MYSILHLMFSIFFISLQAADITLEQMCINKLVQNQIAWQEQYQRAITRVVSTDQAKKLAYTKHSISSMVRIDDLAKFLLKTSNKEKISKTNKQESIDIKQVKNGWCNLVPSGIDDMYIWKVYRKDRSAVNFHVRVIDINQNGNTIQVAHPFDIPLKIKVSFLPLDDVYLWYMTFCAVPPREQNGTNDVSDVAFHPHENHLLFSSTYKGTSIHLHDLKQTGAIIKAISLLPEFKINTMKAFAFDEYIPSSLVLLNSQKTLSFIPLNTYKQEIWGTLSKNGIHDNCMVQIIQHHRVKNYLMLIYDDLCPLHFDSNPLEQDLALIEARGNYKSFLRTVISNYMYKTCYSF